MDIVTLSDDNFKSEVLDYKGLMLVDFWADWCGPCHMLAPTIQELSVELKEKLKVGKLDVDANSKSAQEYKVMGIPTTILFKDGQPVETIVGVRPKQHYIEAFNRHNQQSGGSW